MTLLPICLSQFVVSSLISGREAEYSELKDRSKPKKFWKLWKIQNKAYFDTNNTNKMQAAEQKKCP